MINELVDEFLGTNVKNNLTGVKPFYFISNGLSKVGFAQAYTSINYKGIE